MPLVKIHVGADAYEQSRLEKISQAAHNALLEVLKVPQDDFFEVIYEMPKARFFHPPTFLGHTYSEEFIILEVTFGAGRPPETHVDLLKELNQRIATTASVSPDDIVILLYDIGYNYISFGRGVPGVGKVQ
jgi:Tautomerase enzyme